MIPWSTRGPVLAGFAVLVLGVGGFALWAGLMRINGAVVAPGRVEVEARHQTLQHPDGGLVAEIAVRDGDRVSAGEPLIRMDGTELEAQRVLLVRNLRETLARMDRLLAEVTDAGAVTFGDELTAASNEADVAQMLAAETALFISRRDTVAQTLKQIDERQVQARAGIAGYQRQAAAGQRQLDLIEKELAAQQSLYERGLTQMSRVTALERQAAELEGEIGVLEAQVAETRSAIASDEIERLRIAASRREEAQDELRKLQPQEVQLRENLRVVETRLGRLVLRAPMAGRVLGLTAHTIGGVISPGTDILSVVPEETPLIFTVRIPPQQIDRVLVGQKATLRFPNFDRLTPTLKGEVRSISADTMTDPATQTAFYTAELVLDAAGTAELSAHPLQPGMPLEAFIQTGARTPASFLLKPVTDYMSYAMRER